MAEKSVRPETLVVDHTIYIPDGLESVQHEKDLATGGGSSDDLGGGVDLDPDKGGMVLQPPTTMKVVEQTIRRKKNGQEVVDVVIEVPDAPGVTGYDIRTTKL